MDNFLFSITITLLLYSIFPYCFSVLRKQPISRKKYLTLCYCVNILPMVAAIAIAGSSTGGPYLLWTWVFAKKVGLSQLQERGLILDDETVPETAEESILQESPDEAAEEVTVIPEETQMGDVLRCKNCGKELVPGALFCLECGEKVPASEDDPIPEIQTKLIKPDEYRVRFCHYCGYKLMENSRFCSNCGAEING